MQKEDILKVLSEANKVSGKLTDKQIEKYSSEKWKELGKNTINQNRTKDACSNGGKMGGRTTGDKIKNGEKIGFHAIPMQERIEKHFSKPRPYRRLLSKKDMDYIRKVYYPVRNQFQKVPKGKKRLKELMDMFGVAKGTIHRIIKDNYKK